MIQCIENYVNKGYLNSLDAVYTYLRLQLGRDVTDEEKLAVQRQQEFFINDVQHQFIMDATYH